MWSAPVQVRIIALLAWCAVGVHLIADGWRAGQKKEAAILAVIVAMVTTLIAVALWLEYQMEAV